MVHGASTVPAATESDGHCMVHGTLTMPVATEPDGASPQPPRPDENDAGGSKSHEENTKADDMEDKENTGADGMEGKTATVTGGNIDSTIVASEVRTVNADNQDSPPEPPPLLKQPETRPISQEQLVAEVKGIYAGLVMFENKCIEVDNIRQSIMSDSNNIIRFLEKIPCSKLTRLQRGNMDPHNTIRKWLQALKVQEDVPEEDKKPSTPETTEDSPITPGEDSPTNPEEDSARPHVSEKAAQVPSLEECLHGFLVALELRAKTDEWPEHEELAALTTAEMGEEGRKKVIDGEYLLAVGREVVDQLVRDLEVATAKAEKKKAEKKKAEEAARAKEEQMAAEAEARFSSSYPIFVRLICTCVREIPDSPEAQRRSSDAKQRAALEEVDLEEAEAVAKATLGEKTLEKAEAAPEEAALEENAKQEATQAEASHECLYPMLVMVTCTCVPDSPEAQRRPSDAEQQAALEETAPEEAEVAPEEAGVAAEDAGKDTAGAMPRADGTGADGTVAQAKEQAKEQAKPPLIEGRALDNPNLYKKVGLEYYVRFGDRWIPSLNGEQLEALIALHRTNLHEHHDFFLASQHPSASPALRRLASKYAMPARMWRHGIHTFLDIMRQLPDCQEFTWTFIYLSYSIMSLLDETVPQFKFTWVECKGDVARYR